MLTLKKINKSNNHKNLPNIVTVSESQEEEIVTDLVCALACGMEENNKKIKILIVSQCRCFRKADSFNKCIYYSINMF